MATKKKNPQKTKQKPELYPNSTLSELQSILKQSKIEQQSKFKFRRKVKDDFAKFHFIHWELELRKVERPVPCLLGII